MWQLICLIAAIIIFLFSAFVSAPTRINVQSLGLAFLAAAHLNLPL